MRPQDANAPKLTGCLERLAVNDWRNWRNNCRNSILFPNLAPNVLFWSQTAKGNRAGMVRAAIIWRQHWRRRPFDRIERWLIRLRRGCARLDPS